jgi:release factor glutamine methyltransferase
MENLYQQYKQALATMYSPHEVSMIFRTCVAETLQIDVQKTYFLADLNATTNQKERLEEMLYQLSNATPLQYVLGYETFMDLRFAVTPDVLIPRPETAELVAKIIEEHKPKETLRILDVGTGSGILAILSLMFGAKSAVGTDLDPCAVEAVRENFLVCSS